MDLNEVGARELITDGKRMVHLGIYLPGIRFADGYRLIARVIHETDQFTPGIEPGSFDLSWRNDHPNDLWETSIELSHGSNPESHFGQPGRYLYRYQLSRDGEVVTFWFSDPFARMAGAGTRSAFTSGLNDTFAWEDDGFSVPEVHDLVVYELMVDEFNGNFEGVIARLDYLVGLGVNAIEFMPLTNVPEPYRWGYMPLSFFAPEDRYGGSQGLKSLVNECHKRGIAVIVDAVYAHAHPDFPYNQVYRTVGVANPMMGPFAEDSFGVGTDYSKAFTREFFLGVNRHWLEEYHVDGFRYDYVPGFLDGPLGSGYARLVFDTYQHTKNIPRFADRRGHSRLIQCAEHLPDPKGILEQTYSNSCWQNALLAKAEDMAHHRYVDERFAHLLDLSFLGYPDTYRNDANGDSFPVTAFQYIETHDHSRLITQFGTSGLQDAFGQPYGDREGQWFRLQPLVIALYTCQGVPMLWQGQEFAENYSVPSGGYVRILARRPLHWEFFYDQAGRGLIRLYRVLGRLRRERQALRSRNSFYYHLESRPSDGLIVYRRDADGADPQRREMALVFLNFSDADQQVDFPFPASGLWSEEIDGRDEVHVGTPDQRMAVNVPPNYGRIFLKKGR